MTEEIIYDINEFVQVKINTKGEIIFKSLRKGEFVGKFDNYKFPAKIFWRNLSDLINNLYTANTNLAIQLVSLENDHQKLKQQQDEETSKPNYVKNSSKSKMYLAGLIAGRNEKNGKQT